MDAKGNPTPARVYQDFEPSMESVPEDDCDTLLVYLPGFAKEQLRVQLRSRNLIISGERKLQQNTWSRFRVELPVSVNCDLNKISAKFEGNILFVRQPKLITPAAKQEEEKPPVAAPVRTAVDEPKVPQRTSDEKPTPKTRPNEEIKEMEKAKEAPKMGLEEKSKKASESKIPKDGGAETSAKGKDVSKIASEKKATDPSNKNKKVVHGEPDKMSKTALENYKRAVGVFATKLKTSRTAVNTILILLVGLMIVVYLSDSIRSWRN